MVLVKREAIHATRNSRLNIVTSYIKATIDFAKTKFTFIPDGV